MNTRTSKLIFPAILFLFACLIAFGENGPTPKVVVGSSGISDGSVTNAKLAEPVSVTNGGTGATTAAAGLAALGGASLNGSSTVDFRTEDLNVAGVATFTGFVKLGDAATGVKMKLLTGTLNATAGGDTGIATGLAAYKIISYGVQVYADTNMAFHERTPGSVFYSTRLDYDPAYIYITTDATDSGYVVGKPVEIVIWYRE